MKQDLQLSPEFYRSLAEVRQRIERRERRQHLQERCGFVAFWLFVTVGLALWLTLSVKLLTVVALGLIAGLILVTLLRLLEEA